MTHTRRSENNFRCWALPSLWFDTGSFLSSSLYTPGQLACKLSETPVSASHISIRALELSTSGLLGPFTHRAISPLILLISAIIILISENYSSVFYCCCSIDSSFTFGMPLQYFFEGANHGFWKFSPAFHVPWIGLWLPFRLLQQQFSRQLPSWILAVGLIERRVQRMQACVWPG